MRSLNTSLIVSLLPALFYGQSLDLLEQSASAQPDNLKAASDYRQAAIQAHAFDRSIDLFKRLTKQHPQSAAAELNLGFAFVDKIPAAGLFTQIGLANNAIQSFTRALAIEPSWLGLYARAQVSLYWPKAFGKLKGAIADLDKAIAMQHSGPLRSYYVRAYIALGDAYFKLDNLNAARSAWKEGIAEFPHEAALQMRLTKQGNDLAQYISAALDRNRRVNTDLSSLVEPGMNR